MYNYLIVSPFLILAVIIISILGWFLFIGIPLLCLITAFNFLFTRIDKLLATLFKYTIKIKEYCPACHSDFTCLTHINGDNSLFLACLIYGPVITIFSYTKIKENQDIRMSKKSRPELRLREP